MDHTAFDRFLQKLEAAFATGIFVKLTLSDATADAEPDLRNVYARPVELREGARVQFVFRHQRKDVTKNLLPTAASQTVAELMLRSFTRAYLFTTEGDWQWHGPGDGRLKGKRPTFTTPESLAHDRPKTKAVAGAPWLTALAVTAPDGTARPGMADKLRQVERFTELLGHQVSGTPLESAKTVRLADLGAGKGYLTFAAHAFFRGRAEEVSSIGVEARPELVDAANQVAERTGMVGLEFVAADIANFKPPGSLDVLVALHACNTATDDALHLGIQSGAQLILAAPCCHREVRQGMVVPPVLGPMLRHGILLERYAENLTEGIRALLLEIHGYEAQVFEFISPEHTGKNLMIAARRLQKPHDPVPLRTQLGELLAFHGLREHHLAKLLGEL